MTKIREKQEIVDKIMTIYVLWLISKNISNHGYAIIKQMRADGFYRIGASHIYPLLEKLEKRGYIKGKIHGKRKTYSISEKGERLLEKAKKWMRKGKKIEFFREVVMDER